MVKLFDVKMVSNRFKISMQKALSCILKAEHCPNCHREGILEYYDNSGSLSNCIFCDYTSE